MKRSLGALIALAAMAAFAAFRRRPVKPPQTEGSWQPVHR